MATVASAETRVTAPDDEDVPMSHRQIMEALSGLLLGLFVTILSSTVVSNALPTIISDLHATQTTYTWVITGTLLAMTITTPIWGKLADLVSKKLLIQLALVIFVVGSAIAGQAHNPAMLITARVVQGLGAGGLSALVQVIMAAMISPRERGRYSGYTGAVFALATVGGPLIGGLIVDTSWLGWRWCFYVGVPFAVIALIVLQKTLDLPVAKRKVKIDWLGATLVSGAAALLLLWVSFAGSKYDWLSWQTGAMLGGTVVLVALFIVAENYASEPIVPLQLFRIRTLSLSTLASLFVGVVMFGATTFLSQYFQLARGDSPTKAGLMTLPMIAGLAVASTISGRIVTSTGRWKNILVLGGAAMTAGYGLLGMLRYDTAYWQLAIYMVLVGAGLGMTMQNLVLCVQNQVRPQELGVASSTVSFFRSLGGAIGVSALGALLGNRVTHYLTDGLASIGVHSLGGDGSVPKLSALPAPIRAVVQASYGHGIGDVFLYAAPCALVAVIVILFIKEVPLRTSNSQEVAASVDAAAGGRHARRPGSDVAGSAVLSNGRVVEHANAAVRVGDSLDSGTIRGFVRNGGVPVSGAVLTLIDVGGRQIGRAITGMDGQYVLSAPGSGSYVLIAAAGDYDPQAATLMVGDQPVEFDVTLVGSGGLAGLVRGADGVAIEDAKVVVTDGRGEVVAGGATDAAGGFLVPAVTAGVYTLAVSAPGYRPVAMPVEVGSEQIRQMVELLPDMRVRGTIRVEGRGSVPDARVRLLDEAGKVVGVATTGPDGEYDFTGLAAGRYTVTASGYPVVTSGVEVTGYGDDSHDLWLGHPAE
ncbi:MFS transporter [Nocardia macrotermitis]|uniref:Putative multidrug resistance protein MdtD n=1 Tax=Nocardia macrotermitis TaxID=2585198 RepID=A0A7K0D7H4_9NOCA|nr:MFS transporter [Nocardia macrotermitis]MQY21658.1 putative multidrug resistance protein MdtD [Nocardia macrotermitis]